MNDLPPPLPTSIPRPALPISMPPPLPVSIPRPAMPLSMPPSLPPIFLQLLSTPIPKRPRKPRIRKQPPPIPKRPRKRKRKQPPPIPKRPKKRRIQEIKEREEKIEEQQPITFLDELQTYFEIRTAEQKRLFNLPIPEYNPSLPTNGRIMITPDGKYQNIQINIETINDAALLKAIIENKINKENVPSLFIDLYNNRGAQGAEEMVNQIIRKFKRKTFIPTEYKYTKVNIYYEWGMPKAKTRTIQPINTSLNVSQMPLREQQRKPLNHMYCINYNSTSGKCALDWIKSNIKQLDKLGKKRRDKIYKELEQEYNRHRILTYEPFVNILENNQVSTTIYLITGAILYESQNKNRIHYYFTISNDHIYQLPKKHSTKYKNCKTIYLPEELYEEKMREYKKIYDMSMIEHGHFMICEYKNNKAIKPIKYAIQYQNQDSEINKILKIKGSYSDITEDFYKYSQIGAVYYNTDEKKEYRYDLSKAHRSVLSNSNYLFPVSTGMEKYREYTPGQRIEKNYFYQVELKDITMTPFKEFFPIKQLTENDNKVWLYGELLLELMRTPEYKNNMIILKEFYNFNCKSGNPKIATFDNVSVCHASGSLTRLLSKTTKNIKTKSSHEISELTKIYRSRGSSVIQNESGIEIHDKYFNQTTGVLAKLALLQYVNLNLLHIYHTAKKSNPNVKITSLLSDSIGLNFPIIKTNLKTHHGLYYKLENKKKHDFSTHELNPTNLYFDEIINEKNTITAIDKNDISWIGKKSLTLNGMAGMGKSYYIKNVVIPELKKQNKTFLCSSSTIENCNMWKKDFPESTHIQTIINRGNSYSDMCGLLRPYDYLIIDESSQLNMYVVNMLNYIKKFLNIEIILIGDSNQCLNIDNLDVLKSRVVKNIVDCSIELEFHEKARFTHEYYEFLCKALSLGKKSLPEMRSYILNHPLVNRQKKEDSINICYTHNFGESLDNYQTIHSTQGKTLEEVFNVYELYKIPDYRIIYTAISRARDFKYIRIIS